MNHSVFVAVLAVLCTLSSSDGLKCHEGFNMTLNGIPLYYWTQRDCADNSKCIGQEIAVDTAFTGNVLRTAMRYGSCMSDAYAEYLDCVNLFGKDSTFDPTLLLDMLPGIETAVNNSVEEFAKNISVSLMQFLSNGEGITEFVDGLYIFYENLGFNMAKAEPLKSSIVELLKAVVQNSGPGTATAFANFLNDFNQLDTDNTELETALRSLLNNIGITKAMIDDNVVAITFTKKGPGLLRSIFPSDWRVDLWYDVAFKLMGDVNAVDLTKTTEDMVATIKSSYDIPADIAEYVNPILDAMPDLAKGVQINAAYVGNWSLELLKKFSERDNATRRFSDGILGFAEPIISGVMQMPYEIKTTIEWMPGLFYKFFPADKAVIEHVYRKMGDGFKSVSEDQLLLHAEAPTNLSMMLENMMTRFAGPGLFNQSELQGRVNNALVLKFSKMLYDLMNVTMDYTRYIDTFATVIDEEFKDWPEINVGNIISRLITDMGGDVPPELSPFLENIQDVVSVGLPQPLNHTKLLEVLYEITKKYQAVYPKSLFPELVERYIKIMAGLVTANPNSTMTAAQYSMELQYWNIDMQFAIVKSYNYSSDELYQMLVKAWPSYGVYIRTLKAMNPKDVKELMKKMVEYFSSPPLTTQGFVEATKPTFMKITESITDLLGDIREVSMPNSCRFQSCAGDLCNSQALISSAQEYTKTLPIMSTTTVSTTSGGYKISRSVILNFATLWIAAKVFL